jgi:hypothetical protein
MRFLKIELDRTGVLIDCPITEFHSGYPHRCQALSYAWQGSGNAGSSFIDEKLHKIIQHQRKGCGRESDINLIHINAVSFNQNDGHAQVEEKLVGHRLLRQGRGSEKCLHPGSASNVEGFARKSEKNRHTLTKLYPSYPIPISSEKFSEALKLYGRYSLEKDHAQCPAAEEDRKELRSHVSSPLPNSVEILRDNSVSRARNLSRRFGSEHELREHEMSSPRFNDFGSNKPTDQTVCETLRNRSRDLSKSIYHFSEDAIVPNCSHLRPTKETMVAPSMERTPICLIW